MKEQVKYAGIFINKEDLPAGKLSRIISYPHVTLWYAPTQDIADVLSALVGVEADVTLTLYGNDGVNEGYWVSSIKTENENLQNLYQNRSLPHITVSVDAEVGKPVNTRYFFDGSFSRLEDVNITLKGKFGMYITNKKGAYVRTEQRTD